MIADETVKLLSRHGSVVIVSMDTETGRKQAEGFENRLKAGGLTVKAVEIISMEDMRKRRTRTGIPEEPFLKILEKHRDAEAIVSFFGAPELTEESMARLPEKMPRLVVFAPIPSGLKRLLQGRVVHLAVVRRPNLLPPVQAADGGPKTDPLRMRFDREYQILTPDSDLSGFIEQPSGDRGPG